MSGAYGIFARAPRVETRVGIDVFHPRYMALPRMNMDVAPFSMAYFAKAIIDRLLDEGYDFDLIDAHYFYPDGVAAVLLGKYFHKPVVISALGSDINLILQDPVARPMMLWAAQQAASMITVCQALKARMVAFGMNGAQTTPLRNGVDLALFRPVERAAMRRQLCMEGFTLLSVGRLEQLKGHHHIIAALAELPGIRLMIAGSGPDRRKREALAAACGVAGRVAFLGALPQRVLEGRTGFLADPSEPQAFADAIAAHVDDAGAGA